MYLNAFEICSLLFKTTKYLENQNVTVNFGLIHFKCFSLHLSTGPLFQLFQTMKFSSSSSINRCSGLMHNF